MNKLVKPTFWLYFFLTVGGSKALPNGALVLAYLFLLAARASDPMSSKFFQLDFTPIPNTYFLLSKLGDTLRVAAEIF